MISTTHFSTDGRQIVTEAFKEPGLTQPIPTSKAGTSNSNPTENLMKPLKPPDQSQSETDRPQYCTEPIIA